MNSKSRNPRSASFRATAVVLAVAFLQLELTAAVSGRFELPGARAQVAPAVPIGKERRIALFALPRSAAAESDAQVLQTLMREEVDRLAGVRVVTGSPDPPTSARAESIELIEAGLRALNARDPAAAEKAYAESYERLVRHTGPVDRRLLARTTKGLGIARVMSGNVRGGQEMMKASLNLWPDQLPAEYGFTLDVVNAFKEAQRQQAEETPGRIAVVTDPPGAAVTVGGKVRGYSPLSVADLPPGLHWVQANLDGFVRAGAFVEVRAGEDASQRFALQARDSAEAYNAVMGKVVRSGKSRETAEQVLPVLAQLVGADEIVAVQVGTRGAAYTVEGWYASGTAVKAATTTIARDAEFLGNIQSWLSTTVGAAPEEPDTSLTLDAPAGASVVAAGGAGEDDLFIDPNDPILKGKEGTGEEPLTSKWWFWAVLGGVAAGVTTGAILLFSGAEEGQGPTGDVVLDLHAIQ